MPDSAPSHPLQSNHEPPLIFSRDQIRRIDQLATSIYHIPSLILMENAGRNAAELIRKKFGDNARTAIFCGGGNNGGDGYVIARHLLNTGWSVRIFQTSQSERMTPDALANYQITTAMKIPTQQLLDSSNLPTIADSFHGDEIVIDALLGTGFTGQPRSPMAEIINLLNRVPKRATVAVDVPSGLDCETGLPSTATVNADMTITFVGLKRGYLSDTARPCLGEVTVAEIGAPRELIRAVADGKL